MNAYQSFCEMVAGWSTAAVFFRLLLATIVGICVGIERERKNRGAGIKTHVVVCVGAAIAMIVSEYIYHQFPDASSDMSRNGAAVISGVGFLGVGTIIVTGRNEVKGLTTAAGLWTTACIGLAAGIGFVNLTLIGLGFVLFTYLVLNLLDEKVRKMSRRFELYLEFTSNSGIRNFLEQMHKNNITVSNMNVHKGVIKGDGPIVTITVELATRKDHEELVELLQENNQIRYFEGI